MGGQEPRTSQVCVSASSRSLWGCSGLGQTQKQGEDTQDGDDTESDQRTQGGVKRKKQRLTPDERINGHGVGWVNALKTTIV